jgi:hypothetical protein
MFYARDHLVIFVADFLSAIASFCFRLICRQGLQTGAAGLISDGRLCSEDKVRTAPDEQLLTIEAKRCVEEDYSLSSMPGSTKNRVARLNGACLTPLVDSEVDTGQRGKQPLWQRSSFPHGISAPYCQQMHRQRSAMLKYVQEGKRRIWEGKCLIGLRRCHHLGAVGVLQFAVNRLDCSCYRISFHHHPSNTF